MNARSFAAATTVAAALLMPSVAHGSVATEPLLLDSYASAGRTVTGPVTTTQSVPTGTTATVTVRGTYALYARSLMDNAPKPYVICGSSTTSAPLTPSPGLSDSIAGFDAEFIYRRPFVGSCTQALPIHNAALQLDDGSGTWIHPVAAGALSKPSADHSYRYTVAGTGHPLSFRMRDAYTADNDGVLEISVAIPGADSAPASTTSAGGSPVFSLSSSKSCASRRHFTIHLTTSKRDKAVSATVRVNGKTVKVVRKSKGKARYVSSIDLRGLPRGTVKVLVVVRTKSGKVLKGQRTYHTCVPRKSAAR
jgi:hypothetical protein